MLFGISDADFLGMGIRPWIPEHAVDAKVFADLPVMDILIISE